MSHGTGSRFVFEGLEGRRLLSGSVADDLLSSEDPLAQPVAVTAAPTCLAFAPGAGAAALTAVPQVKHPAPTTPLVGAFNVSGTYTRPLGNPDAGPLYHFIGAGRKRSLGAFTLAGHVHGIGFVANGQYRGYVTLTGSQGTIDVRLLGPVSPPGPLPTLLAYKIVGGTGAYATAIGKGAVSVSASDSTGRFVFRFNQTA